MQMSRPNIQNFPPFYLIIEQFALLAIAAHGVVLAIIADSAGDFAGGFVDGGVKVALVRVVVTVAAFARVRLSTDGRLPGVVVVKILALFAVEALGVVRALASAVHHVGT